MNETDELDVVVLARRSGAHQHASLNAPDRRYGRAGRLL